MNHKQSESVFKKECNKAFSFLVEKFGYRIIDNDEEVYEIKFTNDDIIIKLKGINYGAATELSFSRSDRNESFGIYNLLAALQPSKKIEEIWAETPKGQIPQVYYFADMFLRFGIEIIKGNHELFLLLEKEQKKVSQQFQK